MRPKLFIVPVYIGSLKYYAKLVPYLLPYYEIEFLILRPRDKRRDQMIAYLKENKYSYHVIDKGLQPARIPIPFVTPVWKHFLHMRACRQFLQREKPATLVMTKNIPPYHTIIKEANCLGVDTMVLQWAYGGEKAVSNLNFASLPYWKKRYYDIVDLLYNVLDFLWGGTSYIGSSHATVNRVGIMDDSVIEVYQDRCGISPESMVLVGTAEQQLIHELRQKVDTDPSIRRKLERKYTFSLNKKNILVLVWGLHKRKRWQYSTKEHLEYFREILERIRKVFPSEEADIILKLHPSDDPALYRSFQDFSVKVFGDEAETDELLCLSDLVIVDPWTAANVLVVASGTEAIFLNFSRLTALNAGQKLYHLNEIATTAERFDELLQTFKVGVPLRMYDERSIDVHAIDKIVTLIRTPL